MSDYYSVSQYAELTGKDPGNIRRLLIYGILAGEKLGNQWVIPKGTPYPPDKRVKSGEYRNWRKRSILNHIPPDLMDSLKKLCEEIHSIYGTDLEKIVLYGSYARGEQTEDSDVDIALFVKDNICDEEAKHDVLTDIVVDYELARGITFSVIPIMATQYSLWKKSLPFFINISKEGIVLWKAA